MRIWILCISICCAAAAFEGDARERTSVIDISEVEWTYLNPARKDKAPMAGTLWGDRSGTHGAGFLLKPKDGFESPPHIHNVSYRAITIQGELHNADPASERLWMPATSFWTQPKGDVHITAAKGASPLAYVEIDSGPYLVQPPEQAFDSGETPVNIHADNLAWLDAEGLDGFTRIGHGARVAPLWGEFKAGRRHGMLLEVPELFSGYINTREGIFRAVVIEGSIQHRLHGGTKAELSPGGFFDSEGRVGHSVATEHGCTLYLYSDGYFSVMRWGDWHSMW